MLNDRRRFLSRFMGLSIATMFADVGSNASSSGQPPSCRDITPNRKLRELTTPEEVKAAGKDLTDTAIKGVSLTGFDSNYWQSVTIQFSFFLGCTFDSLQSENTLKDRGAIIFPRIDGLPYNPFRTSLYSPEELLHEVRPGITLDHSIYCDYLHKSKYSADVIEVLFRRIHDDSVDDALQRIVWQLDPKNMIGFMGGSSNRRDDVYYAKTAHLARLLVGKGRFIVSGGGPGMMEAANLGAYFAPYSDAELDQAIDILKKAPESNEIDKWLGAAEEVKTKFGRGGRSLGIPTWFYGFEPTNIFASSIAKYFDNSIREGGLVQIGKGGVVFAPGSAGTRQEVFMDAAQNHYGTTGLYTPMVFLGKQQYQIDTPIYPLLQQLATGNYKDLLYITDEPSQALDFLTTHGPKEAPKREDPLCHCIPD